jgi:aldehyde dehydrogenase (NAD+)
MIDRTPPAVHLRIGAERRGSGSGGVFQHVNPATGQPDAEIPLAGAAEVDEAARTAHAAFADWRATRPAQRRLLLLRLAELTDGNAAEFARRGTLDNGTPLAISGGFVPQSSEWTRYYAGWADKIHSDLNAFHSKDGEIGYTLAQPYGVIGVIITWNGPLISLAMKIPAALAAGNTVVVKPSELTPFTGELFADLVEEAGFPPGVVNVLPGAPAAGAALVSHPLVRKVTFTGGPDTAKKILHSCADAMKPACLELGGKSANIIFDDANLDIACAHGTFLSIAALSGQGCALPTRMLVHEPIYDQVVGRVTEIAKAITVGDPFEETTISGPVVSRAALDRIMAMIEQAKLDGARLVTGGARLAGPLADGYFIEPTVFADVDPQSQLAQREVFGPVLAITPFRTEEEAIAIANGTEYGLSAYVQTNDLRRAHRLADELVAGEVLVNGAANLGVHRPFGGVGLSGFGKEGGRAGLEEFLQVKSVAIV